MDRYSLGVDVGGTAIKLGLFRVRGVLVEKWSIPTDTSEDGAHIFADIATSIRAVLAGRGISMAQVAGLGIGVPGPVDGNGTVDGCVNLGWGVVNVPKAMRALMPELDRVVVDNDANAAALGELRFGGGKGFSSAVLITLGTGIGAGVVLNGRILPGANGSAGEVGHISVNTSETEPCTCGKCGCLEQYASASGLVRLANRLLAASDTASALRKLDSFSARDVCDLARAGDALCLAAVDRCSQALGLALGAISCVIDPEVYILGGGLSRAGEALFAPTRAYYASYAFHPSRRTPILPAKLGNDAGIYGCAEMVLS